MLNAKSFMDSLPKLNPNDRAIERFFYLYDIISCHRPLCLSRTKEIKSAMGEHMRREKEFIVRYACQVANHKWGCTGAELAMLITDLNNSIFLNHPRSHSPRKGEALTFLIIENHINPYKSLVVNLVSIISGWTARLRKSDSVHASSLITKLDRFRDEIRPFGEFDQF